MTKKAVKSVLSRYIDGKIDSETLSEWANIVEGREDICYDQSCHNALKQIIFELANPDLQGPINRDRVKILLLNLK